MRNVLVILLLAVVAYAGPDDWSEPVMIADGEKYRHYDNPAIALNTDGTYDIISRYWDGESDVNYLRVNQNGDVLLGPKLIINNPKDTSPYACAVLNNDIIHVFYLIINNYFHICMNSDGTIISESELFVETNNSPVGEFFIVKEEDNTIHAAYVTYVSQYGHYFVGYTRWNPHTGERLDIEGIVVDDPRVNEQFFNRKLDIDVDSEGNAHIFFDQRLRFEIGPYQMETKEVCWARVDDDSTGEYTSRILSMFYTDGFDDFAPRGTIDSNDEVHLIWSTYLNDERQWGYYSMNNEGNEITSIQEVFPSPWNTEFYSADIQYNFSNIVVLGHNSEKLALGRLDTDGNIVEDIDYTTEDNVIFEPDNGSERFIHHNNGFVSIVWASNDNLYYQHTLDGMDTPEADLRARPADEGLLLTWREAGELTGAAWTLQRDGGELTRLAGETDYAYLDRNVAPGVSYSYTLRAVPPDGEVLTFGPIEVFWPGNDGVSPFLAVPYPNPANDTLTLMYYLPEAQSATLSVYDLSGRRITEQALDPAPGGNSLTIATDSYPPGTYLAELSTSTSSETRRFVISR